MKLRQKVRNDCSKVLAKYETFSLYTEPVAGKKRYFLISLPRPARNSAFEKTFSELNYGTSRCKVNQNFHFCALRTTDIASSQVGTNFSRTLYINIYNHVKTILIITI